MITIYVCAGFASAEAVEILSTHAAIKASTG
ncbi:MAG: hypothetical protein QOE70_2206 [Chthoniobacter sp.]|jgi:hypothetical protein|nr:hypothetical protein [Chthoniobacter sp.]